MSKKYIIGALIAVVVILLVALSGNSKNSDVLNEDLNLGTTTPSTENKNTSDVAKKPATTNTSVTQSNPASVPNTTPSAPNTSTNPKVSVGIVREDTGGLKEKLVANGWYWIKTERGLRPISPDTEIVTPKIQTDFLLTFSSDGNLSIDTDCNSMSGKYTLSGTILNFGPLVSTQMYCEGSVEGEFAKSIKTGTTYYLSFDSAGKMYIVSNETMYFVKK